MRHMSFMLTTKQMRSCDKIVTRRLGWWNLRPGDRILAVEKGMGLKKGEKIKPIGVIVIEDVRTELLNQMLLDHKYGMLECIREGFSDLRPSEFVEMFRKSHNHCPINAMVNRIQFWHEYSPEHTDHDCWCQPSIERLPDGSNLVTHNEAH